MQNEPDELIRLRAESARLVALLESHGIDWRHPPTLTTASNLPPSEPSNLPTAERVRPFRRLFRGRTDVHPVRWGQRDERHIRPRLHLHGKPVNGARDSRVL